MLIPFDLIYKILENTNQKKITGILHIGAHECEEKNAYNSCSIDDNSIYWIEGNKDKVDFNISRGIPNIINALIYDKENEVDFHITKNDFSSTNTESSSILELGTHLIHHPYVQVKETRKVKTSTLKNVILQNKIPIEKLNFWNLDIQGVELQALKSAEEFIKHADYIYLEVNVEHVYKDCALLPEITTFLERNGFIKQTENITDAGWGDALFIRVNNIV
jgi:FkbM family methyltransferase